MPGAEADLWRENFGERWREDVSAPVIPAQRRSAQA